MTNIHYQTEWRNINNICVDSLFVAERNRITENRFWIKEKTNCKRAFNALFWFGFNWFYLFDQCVVIRHTVEVMKNVCIRCDNSWHRITDWNKSNFYSIAWNVNFDSKIFRISLFSSDFVIIYSEAFSRNLIEKKRCKNQELIFEYNWNEILIKFSNQDYRMKLWCMKKFSNLNRKHEND